MTQKEKRQLIRELTGFICHATDHNVKAVLCEDGVETDNDYPVWAAFEPDSKSPEDWINGIDFFNRMHNRTPKLSLKFIKDDTLDKIRRDGLKALL